MKAVKNGDTEKQPPREFVAPVAHGLSVLKSFDRDHYEMTLSEVSERTGMTRAGARRYLLTLAHLGYVEQTGRLFRLTPRVLELGFAFMATMPLSDIAQPYLEQITKDTGETTALDILDDDQVVHLASSASPRQLAPRVMIGKRFNAFYNSTGRVLLALKDDADLERLLNNCKPAKLTQWSLTSKAKLKEELKLVRKQQYAVVDQESEEGLRSLAVPIFNKQGAAVAAISIITNVATVPRKELLDNYLPILRQVARDISAALVTG
jgi:IclR family transcriptional regulator, pca regulon regulatory protein